MGGKSEGRKLARKRHDRRRKERIRERREQGQQFTGMDWRQCKEYFGWRCAYCHAQGAVPDRSGQHPVRLYMDHVEPLSEDGPHCPCNIVPACANCNTRKANLSLLLWLHKERETEDIRRKHHNGR